jgi:hypothetical protein
MHIKIVGIILMSVFALQAQAQFGSDFEKRNSKKKKDNPFSESKNWGWLVWSENASHYRPLGWHVDLGLTYMAGNNSNDDGQEYNLTSNGLPGYYLEGGMEHLFRKKNKLFHYFDWGLGVKHFGGQETYELGEFKDRGSFNFGSAFLRAGIHNVWQITKYNFIDQSIGFNIDYRIYGGKDKQAEGDYLSPLPSVNQDKLVGQLHYSLGFGIKMKDGFFMVPTVQTPVLTFLNFTDFNPSHYWFNSRYQPLIFTIKVAWLLPKSGCPSVFSVDGKRQSDQFQME